MDRITQTSQTEMLCSQAIVWLSVVEYTPTLLAIVIIPELSNCVCVQLFACCNRDTEPITGFGLVLQIGERVLATKPWFYLRLLTEIWLREAF